MITVKEEFLTSDKTVRARKLGGDAVIVMWLAMKTYAACHLTNGFIPDEDLDELPGAPRNPRRAAEALANCGRLGVRGERGAGLVERSEHGWQLHDYLEHEESADEAKERRKLKAERQKRWRRTKKERQYVDAVDDRMASTETPTNTPTNTPTRRVPAQARARAFPPPDPDPSTATAVAAAVYVPCPPPAELLTAESRATLETSMIPGWGIDALLARFAAAAQADQSDVRTLEHWRKCAVQAISGNWHDPKRRPSKPEQDTQQDAETKKLAEGFLG